MLVDFPVDFRFFLSSPLHPPYCKYFSLPVLLPTFFITMAPNYNPLQLQSYIDDVDAVLRAAAEAGSLEQTFEAERSRIVRFFS